MKLHEFMNKYIGHKVDYDGVYGAQCVDLYRQYCKDVLCIPHTGSVTGAKDLFLNYRSLPGEMQYFNAVSTRDVKYGDVIVWDKTQSNAYGHVAICITRLDDSVLVLEQNGFTQDGCHLIIRPLSNMLGILRSRK